MRYLIISFLFFMGCEYTTYEFCGLECSRAESKCLLHISPDNVAGVKFCHNSYASCKHDCNVTFRPKRSGIVEDPD
jgi:archaellum component FlaF (FlaF/FlaG flagellin family)